MTVTFDIPDALRTRVETLAQRLGISSSRVVADALEHGYSLQWLETYLDKVDAGRAAADSGAFATAEDVARVVGKYRPVMAPAPARGSGPRAARWF